MDMFQAIKTRRSIRKFTDEHVSDEMVNKIIEAGIWAPSGLNNQPWKFAIVRNDNMKESISKLTHYTKIVLGANVLIAVFLDTEESYNRTKDVMSVGACIQNMLLYIHSEGLGAVWLGEILNNRDRVRDLVRGSQEHELMAVIALGYPSEKGGKPSRNGLTKTIFYRE
jgi:nitroreductase